jgi:hypothetical protein
MGDHHLTVLRDFGNYRRGDHIEDDAEIAGILGGEMLNHVVKVAADPKPEPAPDQPEPASARLPFPKIEPLKDVQ